MYICIREKLTLDAHLQNISEDFCEIERHDLMKQSDVEFVGCGQLEKHFGFLHHTSVILAQ